MRRPVHDDVQGGAATATLLTMTTTADSGPRRQLRFALSMNGGVSLAVWIGGSVSEIDRVRHGDPFWSDLLNACGYEPRALVDVMTGASAGGLNAVLYAQAIRSGHRYDETIQKLWEDTADIEVLIKDARTARRGDRDPRAILDGQFFLDQLEARLAALGPPSSDQPGRRPQALAVFASATLAAANPVRYRDVPGASIDERRSDAYFHVARRGSAERGLDGFVDAPGAAAHLSRALLPDDSPPQTARALALIGRATCSLPVLFEPIAFRSDTFGARLVNAFTTDRRTVEIVDGGVIDNVPIARAIRAIASSHASTRTRRVLLYLHPDPSVVVDRPAEPTTAIAVGRTLFGKRSESLREDIDLLRAHNAAVERRNVIAQTLLVTIGSAPPGPVDPDVQRSIGIGSLMRAALDPAAELAWHAPNEPRLAPLLDGLGPLSRPVLRQQLSDAGAHELLVILRPRRIVGHLLRLVRNVEVAAERAADAAAAGGATGAPAAQPTDLSAVKERLYEILLLADLLHAYQLARFIGHQPEGANPHDAIVGSGALSTTMTSSAGAASAATAAIRRLRRSREELGSIVAPGSIGELGDTEWCRVATWTLPPFIADPPSPPTSALSVVDLLWRELRDVLGQIPEGTTAGAGGDDRSTQAATTLNQLKDGRAITIEQLDDLLLPLAAEPTASDQTIDFVRIAGNVDTPASDAFLIPGADLGGRVAGVQLRHLGAFFQTSWRTNDFRWGRLDSVPALVDAILDPQALRTLRAWPSRHSSWLGALVDEADRAPAGTTADERLRELLVERRQAQLLAEFVGAHGVAGPGPAEPLTVKAIADLPAFDAWRRENRSLQHLLGTRALTSIGLRGAITGWRVLTSPLKGASRFMLWFLRPVVLGLVGLALAGRRAAAAIALTVCVLAASRTGSSQSSWVVVGVGVMVTLSAILFVEMKIRPKAVPGHGWVDSKRYLYTLTTAAVAVGAVLSDRHDALRANSWAWFAIAPTVAAINAWLLFFWMRLRGRLVMIVLSAGVYAIWSANATWEPFGSHRLIHALIHPFRGMWTCWLLVVVAATSLLGHVPDAWLRPPSRAPRSPRRNPAET